MNRARALRFSILASIGVIPAACGGSVINSHDGDAGSGSTATGQGGSGSKTPGGPGKMLPGTGTAGTGIGVGTSGAFSMGGSFGTGGASGSAGHPATTCSAPKRDPRTGLVTCAEGYQHRPVAVLCGFFAEQGGEGPVSAGAGGGGPEEPNLPRADGSVSCSGDVTGIGGEGPTPKSNCHEFENGYCKTYDGGAGAFAACESGCSEDLDCGPGSICLCDEPDSPTGGACHPSNCRTDSSCGAGFLCATYDDGCGRGFACQAQGDQCEGNADCASGLCGWDDFARKRRCGGCQVGRPFLVESAPRLAPVTSRGDWSAAMGVAPRVDHLTKSERDALAEHWTKSGQMEHASIAAFARFSLQLLALSAPPELVEACTAALADETAHAKLCFGIASAYAGHAIGPGPLDVSRSLEVTSLADIVDLVIAEGCFGETSAALEALELADTATDPVIVAAYTQIAADEQRHAELAFRFVRWALQRAPQTVAPRITLALGSAASHSSGAVARPCLQALLSASNLAA